METIELLQKVVDALITNYALCKEKAASLQSQLDEEIRKVAEKDQIIAELKMQLDGKTTELDALVQKISAALG